MKQNPELTRIPSPDSAAPPSFSNKLRKITSDASRSFLAELTPPLTDEHVHDVRAILENMRPFVSPQSYFGMSREQFINLSPEQLAECYDRLNQNNLHVHELLEAGLSFFPAHDAQSISLNNENNPSKKTATLLTAFELVDYHFNALHSTPRENCVLTYQSSPGLILEKYKLSILEKFILELVHTAINMHATMIDIECIDKDNLFICEITDDTPPLPIDNSSSLTEQTSSLIDLKTITLLENQSATNHEWTQCGGVIEIGARHGGKQVRLSIDSTSHRFFNEQPFVLNLIHRKALSRIKKHNDIEGIILLVDDTLSQLKLLADQIVASIKDKLGILKPRLDCLREITSPEWQSIQLTIDQLGTWIFICASNGQVAYDVCREIPISAMITDQQMPGPIQGTDLIAAVRRLEKQHQRQAIPITLLTTLNEEELNSCHHLQRLTYLNASYVRKGPLHPHFECLQTLGLVNSHSSNQATHELN